MAHDTLTALNISSTVQVVLIIRMKGVYGCQWKSFNRMIY